MQDIVAIDFHVHPKTAEMLAAEGKRQDLLAKYFGRPFAPVEIDALADIYRKLRMLAVILNTANAPGADERNVPNERFAEAVKAHPDVLVGFGALDPHDVPRAVAEVDKIADLGLRGIGELGPGWQKFHPNDQRFYPIWERAAKRKLIVMFHTGMMGLGAGTPGGYGYKLGYNHPVPDLDDIAADFPDLTIVGAHPSWPWVEEGLAVARHKANYFIDLSGVAPKYFPREVVAYANTLLQDKCLFGSDWPALTAERWIGEFDALGLKAEARQKILLDNAKKLLGL